MWLQNGYSYQVTLDSPPPQVVEWGQSEEVSTTAADDRTLKIEYTTQMYTNQPTNQRKGEKDYVQHD